MRCAPARQQTVTVCYKEKSHQARKSQGGSLSAYHSECPSERLQGIGFQQVTLWKGHNYGDNKTISGRRRLEEEGVERQSVDGFQSSENPPYDIVTVTRHLFKPTVQMQTHYAFVRTPRTNPSMH